MGTKRQSIMAAMVLALAIPVVVVGPERANGRSFDASLSVGPLGGR